MPAKRKYTKEEWNALAEELKTLEEKYGKTPKERTRGKYIREIFRKRIDEVPDELKDVAAPRKPGFDCKNQDWKQLAIEMSTLEEKEHRTRKEYDRLMYLRRLFTRNLAKLPEELRKGGLLNKAMMSQLAFEEEKKKYNLKVDLNRKQFEAYKKAREGLKRHQEKLRIQKELEEAKRWEDFQNEEMD